MSEGAWQRFDNAVSAFVRDAVLREVDTTIAADTVVTLSEQESRRFLAALDAPFYLRLRAGQHQRDGIATTHVLIDDARPTRILGYCSLSAARLCPNDLREQDRKRLPAYPVPAVRLGRLAVDARDARAAAFCEAFGFRRTSAAAMTLHLPVGVLHRSS